ncbi:hypothetical protein PspLS_05594, partial [Pyricularia sp. CBS 133598]
MLWLVTFPVLCPGVKRTLCWLFSTDTSLLPVYLPVRTGYTHARVSAVKFGGAADPWSWVGAQAQGSAVPLAPGADSAAVAPFMVQ